MTTTTGCRPLGRPLHGGEASRPWAQFAAARSRGGEAATRERRRVALSRRDRGHVRRHLGRLEQVPVVAGEDHQQVGVDLERAAGGVDQRAEALVDTSEVDDFEGALDAEALEMALQHHGRCEVGGVEVAGRRRFTEQHDPQRERGRLGAELSAGGVVVAEEQWLRASPHPLISVTRRLPDADRPRRRRKPRRARAPVTGTDPVSPPAARASRLRVGDSAFPRASRSGFGAGPPVACAPVGTVQAKV